MEEPWVSLSDRHKQGMWTFLEYCVTRRCCYVDLRCGIQKGGMLTCIASPEDVVTLIFVVAYRRGGCRGWGDVNVHGIASPEVVVTLKMLSRWKFRYVQDVELLLRWTCCCYLEGALTLKMLLRWWFWYVEDVVTLKMLKLLSKRHCGCEE